MKWETLWNPRQTYLKRVAVLAFWLLIWLPILFPLGVFIAVVFGLMIAIDLMVRWLTDDPHAGRHAARSYIMLRDFILMIVVPCR